MAKDTPMDWLASKSASENASLKLPQVAREYFRGGRELFRRAPAAAAKLHSFRLATKRFRYTLELFRPCYGPGLDQKLERLRKVQDYLGDINDCATTRRLLRPAPKTIAVFLARRMKGKTSAMRRYWRESFDAPGQERRWTDYLARFARK